MDQWPRAPAHAAADDIEATAAETEGAALGALMMTTMMLLEAISKMHIRTCTIAI
jgi:hypothetical protein